MSPSVAVPARSWRWRMWAVAGLGLLLGSTAAGAFLFFFHGKRGLTERDTVVLADFANATGDPMFDDTLREGMIVQLEQSPFLSLVSDERIQKTLMLMGHAPDARLTPARCPGRLREDRKRRCAGWFGCEPRKPVCLGIARSALPHRGGARRGADASGQKRRRAACPESHGQQI